MSQDQVRGRDLRLVRGLAVLSCCLHSGGAANNPMMTVMVVAVPPDHSRKTWHLVIFARGS